MIGDQCVLITGAGGLLGRTLTERLRRQGRRVVALTHADLDITREDDARRSVEQARPGVVVNCAATADVDRCEREPDWAYAVNESGPLFLARACREVGAEMAHVSTDYVFDGAKSGYYTQEDRPNPLSVYAKSKLAGEAAVREELDRAYIIRTSWIFGVGGKNFGSRVIEYARKGAKLRAVTDQTSVPTYAPDLAARIEEIVNLGVYELYHVTNSEAGTWYEFARLALDLAGLQEIPLEPITRAELGQPAPRPANSAMRCLVSERLGLAPLRPWRKAVVDFVRLRESQS